MTETVSAPALARHRPAALLERHEARRPRLSLVGAGRAGAALATALAGAGYEVVAVASRSQSRAAGLAARIGAAAVPTPLAAIRAADITFLTVPDPAITPLAASIAATGVALRGRGIVHCAASLGTEALAALRLAAAALGCLHPLQALAGAESSHLLAGSLMAIEADPPLQARLGRIAIDLGGRPVELAPGSRAAYHAAATLAGNAPVTLLAAAVEVLAGAGLDPRTAEEGLIALMEGAIANTRRAGPRTALTGPVARGDQAAVGRHLAALRDRPEADALYRALARATLHLAGIDGREGIAQMLEGRAGTGVREERGLGAGGSRNAAEPRTRHASQGVPRSGPERSTSPVPTPHGTEASPWR